ncbi:MAG: hypothetical protein IKO10_11125 [Lachnospiraceae bacterium]|nr:hypothetical protein [Lachnospiraceae bacterium]
MKINKPNKNLIDNAEEICIFGTGKNACQTYIECVQNGICVTCFVDRDDSPAVGRELYCKKIISETDFSKSRMKIIIASKYWRDICKRLESKGVEEVYVDEERYSSSIICDDYLIGLEDYEFSRERYYIVCPYGLGDTLYVSAFVKELKKQHGIKNVSLIVKEAHAPIAEMFDAVDEIIRSDKLVEKLNVFSIATETWRLKNYLYGHFKKNIQQISHDEYDEKKYSMLGLYRKFVMNISEDSPLDLITYKNKNGDHSIPMSDASVIIAPYAHTAKLLPVTFWEKLVDVLSDKGYEVYTNIAKNEKAIKGTRELYVTLADIAKCAEIAKCVVSIRSGLCDMLAFTKAKMIVIDTDSGLSDGWRLDVIRNDIICTESYNKSETELLDEVISEV